MSAFPTELPVTVTNGYDFSQPDNLYGSNVDGGVYAPVKDYRYGNTPFQLSIVTDRAGHALWNEFYVTTIFTGANKFTIELDSGQGVETHTGLIQGGTVNVDGGGDPTWTISFTFIAERLPIQG